ncbi:protease pro-enzyme activation domain-containing protein [Edaphobacter albus]|uniref:protease pro-enzyme activation domain-containing protein n=1 Tax=Edaphobacter sp. 4G125 TaxID=2763071 RepID=UPI0016479BED|nr:protease pro-enzyme activation domain-containing protein [Edaphobacter sp. 4G125]QNI37157.1 peptidase S53 [Edaphobacter sp. 4G125]
MAHSRTPLAEDARDAGALAPTTQVPGMTLVFQRSEEQEAALQSLLIAQQDPASPLYHRWLTPDEFAGRFGVADQDLAATEAWLTAQGFHVESVARSRDRITFSGTAAQAQAAFGAELRKYRVDEEMHFAPANDLSLPAQLAPMTAAVLHLSDFRPKAYVITRDTVQPNLTSASGQQHFLTPKDIATMYNLTPLYQKNWYGDGQRIAVVGQSYVNLGSVQLTNFFGSLGLGVNVTPVLVPGSGVNAVSWGDQGESEIDIEYASGIAPKADIFLVYVGSNQNFNVFDSLAYAITENIAPIVSISYGSCELALSQSTLLQANSLFAEAAAQGQTLVASSGDSGSTECARYSAATTAQQQALSVSFPASSPYVTAIGGTQMAPGTFGANAGTYWQSAGSLDLTGSLLTYVPEVAWNEGTTSRISAGGGGISSYYPRPNWQSGVPGIPSGSNRLLPDVSFQSSSKSPGFILCTSDPFLVAESGQSSSCNNGLKGSNGSYTTAGGTSFAAPIFAGYLAILNQSKNATGLGNINPTLYNLASNATTYASAFHDITMGTNACTAGASMCSSAGQSSYMAGVGYDPVTGLGSVDFNALSAVWPLGPSASLVATSMRLTAIAAGISGGLSYSATPGQQVPVSITLQPVNSNTNAGNYAGTITISFDGAISPTALQIPSTSSGANSYTASYAVTAPTTAGSHVLTVTYSGDATHAPVARALSLTVGSISATGSMTLSVPNISVANNSTALTQVTVTPTGGYNGRVVWSLSATAASPGAPQLSGCYWITPLLVNGTVTTQLKMGMGSACSNVQPQARIAVQATQASIGADHTQRRDLPAGTIYAGLVIFGTLGMKRRRRFMSLLGVITVALFLSAGLTGCGGSGSSGTGGNNNNPTPPQTQPMSYTFKLTGTDSVNLSITASTTFNMTLQ